MADRTDTFYATDDAVHGYGAQFMVGDGASPETFEAIAAITSITPGEATTADINRTHLRSPDAHHEHMPGMRDHGPFVMTGTYLPDEQSLSTAGGGSGSFTTGGLPALWTNRSLHNFRIKLNDGSPGNPWTFRGYISQFQVGEIGVDDKVSFTCSVMPTESYDLP